MDDNKELRKISIAIPTKNEAENLKRLFKSLDKISDRIEVIIVDSNSIDDTEKVAKSRDFVHFISSKSTAGKARNIAIKHAKYDIIAMLDADTEITDTWYDAILSSMMVFDIVAGWSPDPDGKQLPRVSVEVYGQDITYPQCNIAYKRSVFDKVGFLREDMQCAEDCEFHYRCIVDGYIISYNPLMKAFHHERPTKKQWIKKAIKNGYGRYELNRVHPDLKHKHQHGFKLKGMVRLFFGIYGYVKGLIFRGKVGEIT